MLSFYGLSHHVPRAFSSRFVSVFTQDKPPAVQNCVLQQLQFHIKNELATIYAIPLGFSENYNFLTARFSIAFVDFF